MSRRNDRNRTLYQRLAAIYDLAAAMPLIAGPRRRLFARAAIRPGQRVLLVGVGTGLDLPHLPARTDITGIDLSPAMLARARTRRADATLLEMNAEDLGFPDDSFDVVLLSYVLSVVDDPTRTLAEAARVINSQGSIWILGKFYETPPGPGRRVASKIMTAIGGASLTRSLIATIAASPLDVKHHETVGPLADIIQLIPRDSQPTHPPRSDHE
jgi:ubiquinone/menaquinone biosynthesis C-methylase UbiE